jgi:SAM-dependent methyltransferase
MNEKEDFIKSYFEGFNRLTGVRLEDFIKYYDESIYQGYPSEPGGSMWSSEGKSIYVLIRTLKPKKILEIGNFLGRSSNHILQAIEMNGFGDVVLLDIIERLEYEKLHSNNFKRVIDDSLNYLSNPLQFDLIIQDGDHTHDHVKKEIELILKNNGLNNYYVWAHDYWQRKVPNQCSVWIAWDEMKDNFNDFQDFKDSISDCGFSIAKK